MSLQTSWLQLASLQGFQRVYKMLVLGDYISPHTLTVRIAYDFGASVQTDTITGAIPEQFRIFMARQKCQAVQILITDTPSTLDQGLSLSGLTFEIGVKSGANRLPAAQSFG